MISTLTRNRIVLQANKLTIGYGTTRLLSNIDVAIQAGSLVCLLGPNGVGKSTLLRTLTGMQPALAGAISLNGTLLARLSGQSLARQLGVVLTERPDVGILSTYELVALGRHPYTGWFGRLSKDDEQIIREAIIAVGAEALATQSFTELSDGQRQKIMIARALAQEPNLIVLDEPTAFLDLPHRLDILRLLRQIAHDEGRSVLLTTHDLDLALHFADTIWLMGPAQPIQIGTPEELALNGAIQKIFPAFDENNGGFTVHADHHGTEIAIQGDMTSKEYFWTKRALQRIGFRLQETAARAIQLEITASPTWQIDNKQFQTIADLSRYLQSTKSIPVK